jgi:HD superfamily phosphohydrolase YqeK
MQTVCGRMDGLSGEDWANFSDAERIEHCRAAAREAESQAQIAGLEMRDVYKRLAAQWHMLAEEMESAGQR